MEFQRKIDNTTITAEISVLTWEQSSLQNTFHNVSIMPFLQEQLNWCRYIQSGTVFYLPLGSVKQRTLAHTL
uniref:Uncharacterized protein n=1 Tax=Anguilla anguilla TaxID=7936 RepID=A0A0E9QC98_ANGAN